MAEETASKMTMEETIAKQPNRNVSATATTEKEVNCSNKGKDRDKEH